MRDVDHMRAAIAAVLLGSLAACAGTIAPPVVGTSTTPTAERSRATSPANADVLACVRRLDGCATPADARAFLAHGLDSADLGHLGFDQVTVAQGIDRVLSALAAVRQHPGDPSAIDELCDGVDLYLAVRREAFVHRSAGAASCLPPRR